MSRRANAANRSAQALLKSAEDDARHLFETALVSVMSTGDGRRVLRALIHDKDFGRLEWASFNGDVNEGLLLEGARRVGRRLDNLLKERCLPEYLLMEQERIDSAADLQQRLRAAASTPDTEDPDA